MFLKFLRGQPYFFVSKSDNLCQIVTSEITSFEKNHDANKLRTKFGQRIVSHTRKLYTKKTTQCQVLSGTRITPCFIKKVIESEKVC